MCFNESYSFLCSNFIYLLSRWKRIQVHFLKMHTHKNGENNFKSLNTIVCTYMVAMTMASHRLFFYILSNDQAKWCVQDTVLILVITVPTFISEIPFIRLPVEIAQLENLIFNFTKISGISDWQSVNLNLIGWNL